MTLGERIRAARVRLGMTQKQLAARFGISDQAVSGWERDEDVPGPDKWPQLRLALRVNYAWLHEGHGDPPDKDAPEVIMDDIAATAPLSVRSSVAKAISGLRNKS